MKRDFFFQKLLISQSVKDCVFYLILSNGFVDQAVENAENSGGEDEVDHHVNGIDVNLKMISS